MDQAKVYLGIAKKYHFWILAAIVIVTGLVVWMKASGALAAKYDQDKKTITGAETAVQGAASPDNPNPQFTKKIDGLHEDLKKQVFDAWQKLYQRQVVLFTWPELELRPAVDLNRLRPDEEIPEYVRIFYNEQEVRPMWEELLARAHIRRPKERPLTADADDSDEPSSSTGRNRAVEYEGLVVWSPAKREAIVSRYYTENAVPSSAKMRLVQEDYWLFESLIKVINAVNSGATDSLKAPIKEIDTLDIAQWAVAASVQSGGFIWTKAQAASGGAGMGMGMGMGGGAMGGGAMGGGAPSAAAGMPTSSGASTSMTGPAGSGGAPATTGGAAAVAGAAAGGGAAGANNDSDWFEGRFLDEKGQPLKGNPPTHPFAEFRQVFVYMKLIMDQRQIPNLIAACANADLPIETRQVKVQLLQTEGGTTSAGGGLFGDGGAFGMGGAGVMPSMPGPMGGGQMGSGPVGPMGAGPMGSTGGVAGPMGPGMGGAGGFPSSLEEGGVETTVFDVAVELSGVIYLYNPPDQAKLGTGAAGSPETRSFGVPTTAVKLPVTSFGTSGGAGFGGMGGMGGPMGGSMTTPSNPMGR